MRRPDLILLAFVACLVAGAFATAQESNGGPPPAQVFVDPVREEVIEQYRRVTGEVRAQRRSVLAAQEEGIVLELDLDSGDPVRAGDVVARLDDARARLEVDRAEALVEVARASITQREAEVAISERELERVRQLQARGSASASELDRAETRVLSDHAMLEQAGADLAAARAQLALAERSLEDMRVRAPFDGVIVAKRTEVGQWLRMGDPVLEIVSAGTVEVRVDVPERVVERLRAQQKAALEEGGPATVRVRIAALDEEVEATILRLVPDGDPLSRLFPLRLLVDNAGGRLRPGMSATALVPTSVREPTLTVHKDAVLRSDAGEFVYFDAGGSSAVAPIESLFASGDRVAVRSRQLAPGVDLVVEGNERMAPGQPLIVLGRLGENGERPGREDRGSGQRSE